MNIYQKICVAIGAIMIAGILLMPPKTGWKEVPNVNYNADSYLSPPTFEIKYKDYNTTILGAMSIAVGTLAITILLGCIPKKKEGE